MEYSVLGVLGTSGENASFSRGRGGSVRLIRKTAWAMRLDSRCPISGQVQKPKVQRCQRAIDVTSKAWEFLRRATSALEVRDYQSTVDFTSNEQSGLRRPNGTPKAS